MCKKTLIEKFNKGELKPIGTAAISNNSGIAVCHIEHGINDKVFGYYTVGETKKFFYVTLKYLTDKIVFYIGKMQFDIGTFIRA